jgi:tetratricopeptide (TPR) repeat protein
MSPSPCPSYDDLIRFADNGGNEAIAGHDPGACASCGKHLREYDELRAALRELRGLEDYSAATLRENAAPTHAPPARTAPPDDEAGRVLDAVARARGHYHADWGEAKRLAETAWRAARALPAPGNPGQRIRRDLAAAEASRTLGTVQTRTSQLEEGIALLETSIDLWETLGEPVGLGCARSDLAVALSLRGDLARAESAARAGIDALGSVGQTFELAKARHILALVLLDRREFSAAKAEIQQAIPVYRRLEKLNELAMAYQIEGSVALETGDAASAAGSAAQAQLIFTRLGNALDGARARWLLGRAQIAGAGNVPVGLANLELARRHFSAEGLWIEAAMILCQAGRALLERGDRPAARTRLEALQLQLPADQANSWVSDAARTLRERLADGDMAELSVEFESLTKSLEQLHASPVPQDGRAH